MTSPAISAQRVEGIVVTPATPVLLRREFRPNADTGSLSLFGDDAWELSAAVPDRHSANQAIQWVRYPATLREATKLYVFALVNVVDDAPRLPFARSSVPAVKTIWNDLVNLRVFLKWLDDRGIAAFAQVTIGHLDDYLRHIQDARGRSTSWKRRSLLAVQRLHAYRDFLPEDCRLPEPQLWGGATAAVLAADPGPRLGENRTPRIPADEMEILLSAALLVSSTMAADLRPIADRLLAMRSIAQHVASPERFRPQRQARYNRADSSLRQLDRLLAALISHRQVLPGVIEDGRLVLDAVGLALGGWIDKDVLTRPSVHQRVADTGLRLRRNWFRLDQFSTVSDRPWRTQPVDAAELARLVRYVITACFLVITYLSGVRTGEALNLQRGCISRDQKLGLIFMSGQQMKAEPPRRERSLSTIPWVVVEPVAAAVTVLEGFSTGALLFPAGEFCSREWFTDASTRARTPGSVTADISAFIAWFNAEIASATGHPLIPKDDHGKIAAPRLRRTLAWHIVRRPGGTVAGATQYGHLHTQITQGYAGLADSGFADEIAFEQLLLRAETIHDDAQRLTAGEQISGPAAAEYRDRVLGGAHFAGMTIATKTQVKSVLSNPALSIHHGELLTCVYRPDTAACREGGEREGPDWGRCRLTCRNIARTDRDISAVKREITGLEADMNRLTLPQPLHQRIQERLDHLRQAVADHHTRREQPLQPTEKTEHA